MDLIELLVAYGASVSAADPGIVITASDLTILKYLLSHGLPVTQPGKNRYLPLNYVSRSDKAERPDKVKMLLEHGAPINAIDPKGRTALHWAVAAGHLKVMTVLLDHGADFMIKDHENNTALAVSINTGKMMATALLRHYGANH